jgi:acyl carrier protein
MAQLRDAREILRAAATTRHRDELALEAAYLAPETDVERRLVNIWGEVLDLEGIGIDDGFFELGGDSLHMTQVIARIIDALGVEVPIETFFDGPTIRHLAATVATLSPLEPGDA